MPKTLTGADQYSDPISKGSKEGFSVSVTGTFIATLTVQRSKDKSTWYDVQTATAPGELDGSFATPYWLRIGIKSGGFTSGSATVEIY